MNSLRQANKVNKNDLLHCVFLENPAGDTTEHSEYFQEK